MLFEYTIETRKKDEFYNIAPQVMVAVRKSGIDEGTCLIFCPHTTAAVTINENADPDVVHDLILGLDKAFPDRPEFLHGEGNSSAHLKASCIGSSVMVIVENGKLKLGTWQTVYFCDFDGPRTRKFYVQVL